MIKGKILTALAAGIAMTFVAGCNVNNVAVFDYTAAPEAMVQLSPHEVSVALMPFEDNRFIMQEDNAGSLWWGFLPLAPFGRVITNTPENSENFVSLSHYAFNPAEDLGNAAFVSLKYSNIFSELSRTFTPHNTSAEYLLYGKINSTNYAGVSPELLYHLLFSSGTMDWFSAIRRFWQLPEYGTYLGGTPKRYGGLEILL